MLRLKISSTVSGFNIWLPFCAPLFKNISINFDMSDAVDVAEPAAPVVSSFVGSTTTSLPSTSACAAVVLAFCKSFVCVPDRDISKGLNKRFSTRSFQDCCDAAAATSPATKNPGFEYCATSRKLSRGLKNRQRAQHSS